MVTSVSFELICVIFKCTPRYACELMSPVEIELLFYVATGFDLMEFFSVRDILGTKEDDGQSSYVRLGAMPIVQQTE